MFRVVLHAHTSILDRSCCYCVFTHNTTYHIPNFVFQISYYYDQMASQYSGNRARTRRGSMRRLIHSINLGRSIVPPADPPTYAGGPWWPLTVSTVVTGTDKYFKPKDIHSALLACLKLTGFTKGDIGLEFRFRLLSVRVWGTKPNIPIQLSPCDFTGPGSIWVKEINDYGSPYRYSRVGWEFGDAFTHRVFSLRPEDDQTIFTISASTKTKFLVYMQILIRVPSAAVPSKVSDWDSNELESSFENLSLIDQG